jgi:hypothetical protein
VAVTDVAQLFGFGSYFKADVQHPKDVDLLILHRNTGHASIGIAIAIKSLLTRQIPGAHIVMLSEQEERDVSFIKRSGASLLGTLRGNRLPEQASAFSAYIRAFDRRTG